MSICLHYIDGRLEVDKKLVFSFASLPSKRVITCQFINVLCFCLLFVLLPLPLYSWEALLDNLWGKWVFKKSILCTGMFFSSSVGNLCTTAPWPLKHDLVSALLAMFAIFTVYRCTIYAFFNYKRPQSGARVAVEEYHFQGFFMCRPLQQFRLLHWVIL